MTSEGLIEHERASVVPRVRVSILGLIDVSCLNIGSQSKQVVHTVSTVGTVSMYC